MNDQQTLPEWSPTGRPATNPLPSTLEQRQRGGGRFWLAALGVLALIFIVGTAIGVLAASFLGDDEPDVASTAEGNETTSTEAEPESPTTEAVTETEEETTTTAEEAETTVPEPEEVVVDSESGRQAVLRGGVVYLQGRVPSAEISAAIEEKAAAVVGPDNVVNEHVIDESIVFDPSLGVPIYVEDVVLFDFNSNEIREEFIPVLNLGVGLLTQNPQATLTIVARTDAVGSEEVNLEVAQRRGETVYNYLVAGGVDPGQLTIDARGEEGAVEDATAEQAQLERRTEFQLANLILR